MLDVTSEVSVAVIMRSKNEQPHIERSLKALHQQNYRNFKLYNVDSGSTDGSFEAVQKWNPDQNCIVLIKPEEYVPGKVLNAMVEKAAEPIIVLLNSDAVPMSNDWLSLLLNPILKGDADATMSRQISRKDAYFIVDYDYIRAYDPKNIKKNPYFYSAVACAFRRELWEEVSFYTEGYSEDMHWSKVCQKKGARFQYVPESVVEHSHNYTYREHYTRRFVEAEADVEIFGYQQNLLLQGIQCIKELARDLFYALRKGRINTIPYNILYRVVAHKGIYDGLRQGNGKRERQ